MKEGKGEPASGKAMAGKQTLVESAIICLLCKRMTYLKNCLSGIYFLSASLYTYGQANDDVFCDALRKIVDDAPSHFVHLTESKNYTTDGDSQTLLYNSMISLPGASKTEIRENESTGGIAVATLGKFELREAMQTAFDTYAQYISSCFRDFYYEGDSSGQNGYTQYYGRKFSEHNESPFLQLINYQESESVFGISIIIKGGANTSYYGCNTENHENSFGIALRTLYDDIKNDFANVLGTKHLEADEILRTDWFESKIKLPDAISSRIDIGIHVSKPKCTFVFGFALPKKEAETKFDFIDQSIKNSIGNEFLVSGELSSPHEIYESLGEIEKCILFSVKRHLRAEKCPVLELLLVKTGNDKYLVKIVFEQGEM